MEARRTLISWTDQYSVGVELFDVQHKQLIGIINKLHTAMLDKTTAESLTGIFDELITYTEIHFRAEEEKMRVHKYPEYGFHQMEHRRLVKEVTELRQKHLEGKVLVSVRTMDFLRNWLMKHIEVSDKRYTDYFNSRGVA